jgi:hypothetical protein
MHTYIIELLRTRNGGSYMALQNCLISHDGLRQDGYFGWGDIRRCLEA